MPYNQGQGEEMWTHWWLLQIQKKYSLGKLLSWAKQDWLSEHLHIITQILMGEWMNKQLESDVIDAAKCSVSEQSS